MHERISRTSVTFTHPFKLPELDKVQPSGVYEIETTEELIPGLSFVAYRRTCTTIEISANLKSAQSRQIITIDPSNLQDALAHDAE